MWESRELKGNVSSHSFEKERLLLLDALWKFHSDLVCILSEVKAIHAVEVIKGCLQGPRTELIKIMARPLSFPLCTPTDYRHIPL